MKLIVVSLIDRTYVSYDDVFDYKVTEDGKLDILDRQYRTIATWARGSWAGVSRNPEDGEDWLPASKDDISSIYVRPPVLGEINQYLSCLVGS
jgi:hypothetical protein